MAETKKKRTIAEQFQPEQNSDSKMSVVISDFEHGVREYFNVQAIRIRSKDYTLLIMDDYISTLGELDGTLSFVTDEDEYIFEQMRGFYCHRHNRFEFLVRENCL